ncbi:MAG TPA: hypothetical protein P5186_17395 [Candidatus Paceibacterota bacterium]|nr:hypothetical protein [Verrucomicrobiota bacterium]HRY49826.1 hypothetical protein [Candidatus Paceibacterota bacterium]HRZ99645.1 hypothetical protein [Candidatus Paceibacterota bacterium]
MQFPTSQPPFLITSGFLGAALFLAAAALGADTDQHPVGGSNTFPVVIHLNAAKAQGPMRQIWRFFGADEPNYATVRLALPRQAVSLLVFEW